MQIVRISTTAGQTPRAAGRPRATGTPRAAGTPRAFGVEPKNLRQTVAMHHLLVTAAVAERLVAADVDREARKGVPSQISSLLKAQSAAAAPASAGH